MSKARKQVRKKVIKAQFHLLKALEELQKAKSVPIETNNDSREVLSPFAHNAIDFLSSEIKAVIPNINHALTDFWCLGERN